MNGLELHSLHSLPAVGATGSGGTIEPEGAGDERDSSCTRCRQSKEWAQAERSSCKVNGGPRRARLELHSLPAVEETG